MAQPSGQTPAPHNWHVGAVGWEPQGSSLTAWMLHVASVCTPCCICVLLGVIAQSFKTVKLLATPRLACLAGVSNRVIARKLERKRKIKRCKREGEGRRGSFFPLPLPRHSFFLLSFSTNSRGNACYAGYSAAVHRRYRSAGTPKRRRKHGDLFSWRAKN